MRLSNLVIATFASFGLCSFNYEDSLKAVLQNEIDPNDGSKGEVWFNATNYGLEEYGLKDLEDYAVRTYSSYNYLKSVSKLASVAANKGYHGDIVLLLYKFLYGGQHNSTALDRTSDMVLDIAKLLKSDNEKRDGASLLELLTASSSSDVIKDVYQKASETDVKTLEKRWTKVECSLVNQASTNACRILVAAVKDDSSWNSGISTSTQYGDCFISWSANVQLQYSSLYTAANLCLESCSLAGVSCKAFDVYLGGAILNQCLSNRASGCVA